MDGGGVEMGPWMTADHFMVVTDRRKQPRHTPVLPCPHYVCPFCPFEGDEAAMADHALDCGHIARMADEGCPNA